MQTIFRLNYHGRLLPTQAVSQLHSLLQAAGGMGLHVEVLKAESVYLNQKGHLAYYDSAVHRLNHYNTRTRPKVVLWN